MSGAETGETVMINIACLGDNCIDYYDRTGDAFPGGNPVNVAVYTRRLGGAASYIGAVGTDRNGDILVSALQSKGVDTGHVQRLPGATALTHVILENGNRVFGEYEEGVMADFVLSDADIDFLCTHDLVVSGLWGRAEHALCHVKHRGIPVAFDCADRPEDPAAQIALPQTTVAFFSDDGADGDMLKARMLSVAALGPKITVATRGHRGSLAYDGKRFFSYGIVPCPVVDTMGAGDSYIAGFLCAYLSGADIPACMASGAQTSAVTLGYAGAW